jgi:hypothetical protein
VSPGARAVELLDALAVDLLTYRAGHQCRKCQAHITDHEYLDSGLFFSLCAPCLASARQAMRTACGVEG